MKRIHAITENTRIRVKINTWLTNFEIKPQIDEYNNESWSNLQRFKIILQGIIQIPPNQITN